MNVVGFDWDEANRGMCQKHGVSVDEIEAIRTTSPRIAPDLAHSSKEDRFVATSRNSDGRAIFVGFTFRVKEKKRFIRPVSARYMHKKESASYENEGS